MLECLVLALVGVVVLTGGFVILTYNRLVSLRNRVNNAWAQIDVQLKRRYDLIPNLMETVKGYMKHEKEVLKEVTKYRSRIVTGNPEQKARANNKLTDALKSVFAVAESYPDLKANENFKMLQEELAGTENKIAYIRTAYNDSVLALNTACDQFPSNLVAGMLGFKHREYFETAGSERKTVKVKF